MTGGLYRLAGFCVRHRKVVVGSWIVLAIAITFLSTSLGKQFADNLSLPGKDSQQASDLVDSKFPSQANGSNPVLFKAKQGKITDSSNQKAVESAIKTLSGDSEVTSINDPFSANAPGQVSQQGKIAYASMLIGDGPGEVSDETAQDLVDKAHSAGGSGLDVAVGGYVGQQVSKPSTESSEVVGLVVAMIVLALTFGTIVAIGLPIFSALFGLLVSLGLITILSNVATVATVAPTLSTMIGLGVGIDYALFVVTRHRQAMHQGHEPPEAAARAAATAGGAVVFAGSTVVVALLSLGLAGIPLVWTLGYTAAIAVIVAMIASITFLPALLAMVGHRIDRLKIPLPHNTRADHEAHGWRRWAEGVARRPIQAVVVSVLILLVIAIPARNLHLGQEDDHALPKSTETRQAYDLTTQGFGVGQNGPLLIAMDVGSTADVNSLSRAISKAKGIASVTPPALDKAGDAAIFNAIPTTSPSSTATEDTVNRLRDSTIPDALKGTKSEAHVGGQTAGYVDLAEEIADKLPQVILLVVALSFLVLMVAFRSIVLPLQAAVMNLLSIAAAYGLVTFVFQEGHGATLIGLEGAVPVVSFLPLVLFAILFGLSMDYEVFLLTQIKEAWHRSGDSDAAVIAGVTTSGRVITSAALIMVAVFFSFVLSGDPVVKQFGVGLAFAVAIDATIVRCLLVPAVMILMKRSNWWFPAWLDRIVPRIDIEGNEYFENRETDR
ncbi:MAG: MMPL family transporter [Solirubrobacterales bacterium]|nr:MMPL family transporter [Solirubrobacterales bacterium]